MTDLIGYIKTMGKVRRHEQRQHCAATVRRKFLTELEHALEVEGNFSYKFCANRMGMCHTYLRSIIAGSPEIEKLVFKYQKFTSQKYQRH